MMRTPVSLLLNTPIAISSAMIAASVSALVSPGTATMSRPTEQTALMLSSRSSDSAPTRAAATMPASSLTGMNAPDSPPTDEDAITPPFFTASVNSASAATEPGAPARSSPIASRISATESPTAGVGASDRSTTPNRTGGPRRRATSRPISSPARVTLNAIRLIVSAIVATSYGSPVARRRFSADSTTPGPEQPTLITHSPSPTPCMAPATNGLSSGMLANVTSLAQPIPPAAAVASASALTTDPISSTASAL